MPVIQLDEQQFALTQATTRIGTAGADVVVPGDPSLGVQALIDLTGDGGATIRRAREDAAVRVNGIALGAEPTPLIHGDKVEIGGAELMFAEDQKAGATQFLSSNELATLAAGKKSSGARPTTATGGRLVSLVDGKEYAIGPTGVVLGRDASCEVVVPLPEVSRRHAQIAPVEDGYLLTDMSTNGVLVNGERIQGTRVLMRSDIIRVGSEEFRFYADVAPAAKGVPAPANVPSLAPTGHHPAFQGGGSPGAPAGVPAAASMPVTPAPAAAPAAAPAPVAVPVPAPAPAPTPVAAPAPAAPRAPAPAAPVSPVSPVSPVTPAPVAPGARPPEEPVAEPVARPTGAPTRPRPTVTPEPVKKGIPAVVWLLVLLLVAAGAFLVLR